METRLFLIVSILALAIGCSSFRAVERGDWRRAYTKDASTVKSLDAPQEIITREKYEEELANDVRRTWSPSPGWQPAWLTDVEEIGLAVGEVNEFRINEVKPVEVQVLGSAAELYWGARVKKDEWKDGTDVTRRESTLFVKGKEKGKVTIRLVLDEGTKDIPLTVR
ncbi:MAG: Ig-like domain-containing protein [Myxococcaceae bacterium]|jgi:hypothetical protein|nr:Ig-like domain-containing protein [Myxococcaceae bacterium]